MPWRENPCNLAFAEFPVEAMEYIEFIRRFCETPGERRRARKHERLKE
ncbi:MAG: hypothetical protein LBQ94_03280 [Treponema sp.]|nr:hypothetical protein [Treponema sp.]